MTSDDTRMPAARNDAGAACETQELLQLFDEAQAAGAVRRVGARDWPPPRCAAPRAPRAEDGDPATLSLPAETGVLTARQGRHDRGALTAEGALRIFHARAQRSGNTVHLAAELARRRQYEDGAGHLEPAHLDPDDAAGLVACRLQAPCRGAREEVPAAAVAVHDGPRG